MNTPEIVSAGTPEPGLSVPSHTICMPDSRILRRMVFWLLHPPDNPSNGRARSPGQIFFERFRHSFLRTIGTDPENPVETVHFSGQFRRAESLFPHQETFLRQDGWTSRSDFRKTGQSVSPYRMAWSKERMYGDSEVLRRSVQTERLCFLSRS